MLFQTFRPDFLWLLPALIIALIQVFLVWGKLPFADHKETEVRGKYDDLDFIKIRYFMYFAVVLFLIQLVTPLFPISKIIFLDLIFKVFGLGLIITGFVISLSALKELGDNWTGMDEYRIKKGQQLVTTGIYRYIRHPIYSAVLIEVLGYELLTNSLLILPVTIGAFIIFNNHIKLEEELLASYFQEKFLEYKKTSFKLIPKIY